MNGMARRIISLPLLSAVVLVAVFAGPAGAILARMTRSETNQALKLGRAPEEEWREFVAEWRLEDSLLTRPVKRVEIWTPFNRLAEASREARFKRDMEFQLKASGLQQNLQIEYRDELVFVVSYVVRKEADAERYRAELRPEKGDPMGPIATDRLFSFRWAGDFQMVRIKYSFPKILLEEWEGPVSLFLVPQTGEPDGPWLFDLSKVR
jgi:hypothetical protein